MKKCLLLSIFLVIATLGYSQDKVRWIRYPSISPDGSKIAFGYKGDIYLVASSGGTAIPLTIHEAHDMNPVWSRDGKHIAFASDRYGNFDVFTISVNGGTPKRLTYHSAADIPQDFSPDNKTVLFTSARGISNQNVRFYSPRLFNNLYTVALEGGKAKLISEAGMNVARYNTTGTKIVFQDRKGYEDFLRKHHTSSVTRDIWTLDLATSKYEKQSTFSGEDLEPCFAPNSDDIYFTSEQSGSLNIVLSKNGSVNPITQFSTHPVRHLSVSGNNTLCFTYNGDVYTKTSTGDAKKIGIEIQNDGRAGNEKNISVSGSVTQFALSPNGKEIAFVNRGEIFVTSVEGTQTKRVTNTPQQERDVRWDPDGRSIIYSTERGKSWDIYKSSIIRKDEPYFYAATTLHEEPVLQSNEEEFQGKYSPDGKEIAYIAERNVLKIYNIESKQSRVALPAGRNYSYADGDWDFVWSSDSKHILCDDGEGNWSTSNVALLDCENDNEIVHPMPSGFGQGNVKWAMKGRAMTWMNAKNGRSSVARQGSKEFDIYIGFFDQAAYDRFSLSKEEFALIEEKEKKEKEDKEKKEKEDKENGVKKKKVANDKESDKSDSTQQAPLVLTRFEERVKRLTINSSSIGDYVMNAEGTKLYYLSAFEKGFDLWVTEPRTKETKILAKLGAGGGGIEISKDGKTLFVIKDGSLTKIDDAGKVEPIGISGEMVLNSVAERAYILEHAYRQVQKKFYDTKLHGIDWPMYYNNYANFLPHISNNYDFQELLSEFLGELNASHTGGRYSPVVSHGDETASLGLLYDEKYEGGGLKVSELIAEGPFSKASTQLKAGCVIEKIDGVDIQDSIDWTMLLNRKNKKNVLISFRNADDELIEEVIKPISLGEENGLMYKRWLAIMKDKVSKLSNGQVGYAHVQGMNDGSYRDFIDEVLGANFAKKALVVDTRFNGGGWLHDDLLTFLSGKRYLDFAPQGNRLHDGEPLGRWTKPSCVLMSEGNYSDAFIFPYVYKQAGIGLTIGKAVPGTGTAVWWERQIDPTMVFGIPMIATIGKENRPTENLQVEPDIEVNLTYEDFLHGKDTQLEEAVKAMLKTVK
ncbi:MAG: PD40 domain-containing protein [Bacteroidetes bacterium]|nr:PD40 domain-containing protein [Bacteroidota bacterium]